MYFASFVLKVFMSVPARARAHVHTHKHKRHNKHLTLKELVYTETFCRVMN